MGITTFKASNDTTLGAAICNFLQFISNPGIISFLPFQICHIVFVVGIKACRYHYKLWCKCCNFIKPLCGYSMAELEPRLFSFNNPAGACQACDGLGVKQYFDANKVIVIPPGIDTDRWNFGTRTPDAHTHLLFVGGDFYRKGGQTLLDAWRGLSTMTRNRATLHIVTQTDGIQGDMAGIQLHYGLTPNSNALIDLYRIAGAFVFPSNGDCLPLAVLEALAAGLPVAGATITWTASAGTLASATSVTDATGVAAMGQVGRALHQHHRHGR